MKNSAKIKAMLVEMAANDGLPTLAQFIARELKDTFDPRTGATTTNKLAEAHRVMSRAATQLGDVAREFSDLI